MSVPRWDLLVLVADKDAESTLRALFARPEALGIASNIRFEIMKHPNRDGGCFADGDRFLAQLATQFRYGLILLDHHGSGRDRNRAAEATDELRQRLARVDLGERTEVLLLEPELEIWVWSDSPHVAKQLGWSDSPGELREWLEKQGLWLPGQAKPVDPKEAMERALAKRSIPRSSSNFSELAVRVGLNRCQDPSFIRFKAILGHWFPPHST